MAGLHEVCRCRFRISNRLNRRRAIVRADARGHALRRIHRDREIGPMHFAILRDHLLKPELFRALRRDRHADQTAPVHGHEVDRLRRSLLRRHDEIAFILSIGIVGHDHNPARGDIAQDIVDGIELHDFRSLSNHSVNITSRVLFGNSSVAAVYGRRQIPQKNATLTKRRYRINRKMIGSRSFSAGAS